MSNVSEIVKMFCRLQRCANVMETTYFLGMSDRVVEMIRTSEKLLKDIELYLNSKGENNGDAEKAASNNQESANTDAAEQSGGKTVP